MMLKIFFALLVLTSFNAFAENEAGVVLGTATGFSGLLDLKNNRAVDVGVAYNVDSSTYIYGDYLFTNARSFAVKNSLTPITLYYGLGARALTIKGGKDNGKAQIGPRAPIGLHYDIINPDISLFGELAVVLNVTPSSTVDVTAGIGVRVRF